MCNIKINAGNIRHAKYVNSSHCSVCKELKLFSQAYYSKWI